MGNRAHARIEGTQGPAPIYLYTHWDGPQAMFDSLKAIVESPVAQSRAGDPEYFIRIVIHKYLLAHADPEMDTGYGIGTAIPDGPLCAVIDATAGTIRRER